MSKKVLGAAIAAACLLALTAHPAQASAADRSTIVVSVEPDFAVPVSCSGAMFGFGFNLSSPAGSPLGTGQSCVHSIDGCDPFVPFCRQTVRATLTLDLARGSLTVPMTLLEVLPSESSFVQSGHGTVAGGTGAYARASGRMDGGGSGSFGEQGFEGSLVYALQLRGLR